MKWFDLSAFLTNIRLEKKKAFWRETVRQKFHCLISTNKKTPASEQTQVPYCSWNLSINSFSEFAPEMPIILALQRIKRDNCFVGTTHWVWEKFLHISLPQLLDDGLHLSNQRMDASVTNTSEKPLTWWIKMDKLITGAPLKGTYHMGVWFPKRQEVGAKRNQEISCISSILAWWKDSLLSILRSVEDTFLAYSNLLQNFCFPAQEWNMNQKVSLQNSGPIFSILQAFPRLLGCSTLDWCLLKFFKCHHKSWWKVFWILYAFCTNISLNITTDYQEQIIYLCTSHI